MGYALANVLNLETPQIWVWEEDGVFIAKCLDISGCVSQGDTRDQALANIHDAIALCLDVIKEDSAKPRDPDAVEAEMIERPISVRIPRDVDQRSELMSIMIPNRSRSAFRTEADQFYGCGSEW